VHIRLPEEMLAAVDALSRLDDISRSEAIRRLVDLGLKAKK
jgi:metal-responsive CopG/Arc/MetJ family transcriptional regulator